MQHSASFPADETGELLRLMQEQGDDLSVPRDVDFYLLFDRHEDAAAFEARADLGPEFRLRTARYERTDKWQVCITLHMLPVYAELVALEKQVARLGREHGGQADGWGCAPAV